MNLQNMQNLPPESELEETFMLASGPGGQHVNRSETGVQLRYDVHASEFLTTPIKRRLLRLAGQRATTDGVIVIEAKSHRSQYRNREEARQRLSALIEQARKKPKRRVATRPSRASRLRWKKKKQRRREVKRNRRPPRVDE